jgi:hypothetical protein
MRGSVIPLVISSDLARLSFASGVPLANTKMPKNLPDSVSQGLRAAHPRIYSLLSYELLCRVDQLCYGRTKFLTQALFILAFM